MSSRSQSQARPLPTTDSKSKQDVSFGSKPGKPPGSNARGGRGRRADPQQHVNPSNSSSNPRRPLPRGARGWGGGNSKQPLNRGYPVDHYQQQLSVTEADEFEVGSLYKTGSKKQSLNHLLNFQYTPRGNEGGRRGRGDNRAGKHQRKPVYRQTYSKEEYLQANCQFVVSSLADYSEHAADPDLQVPWHSIEEVYLKTAGSDPLSCPICLFPPTAGKISKCGHVFCWSCILHYLALSDDDWRKCPICYDNIHRNDLKSVQVFQQENLGTGSMIEMRLMKRDRNSVWSVPVNHPGIQHLPGIQDSALDKSLSKLIKATPGEVSEVILQRERRELEAQYREDKEEPEAVFIKEAIALLEDRILKNLELSSLSPVKTVRPVTRNPLPVGASALPSPPPPVQALQLDKIPRMVDPFESSVEDQLKDMGIEEEKLNTVGEQEKESARPRYSSSGSEEAVEGCVTAADLDISGIQSDLSYSKHSPKSTFYFYQDASGQLIFLHALNAQMLVKEFGALEQCPPTIKAVILEKDSSIMSEDLRHRTRYLGHLPVSSAFEVAELDLSALVSKNTVAAFKDQLEDRKRKRQKKKKDEKLREKHIRREEMRIMGRYPSPMARIESAYHYPIMGESPVDSVSSFPRGGSSNESLNSIGMSYGDSSTGASNANFTTGASNPSVGASAAALSWVAPVESSSSSRGPNFASVAKKAPAAALSAPVQKMTQYNGMVQLGGKLPAARVRKLSDNEPDPEGYVPPPPTSSIGDALALALARADSSSTPNNKKKGKKSRGTPILLTGGGPRA